MPNISPVSMLRKAIEVLKTDGWIQGALHAEEYQSPGERGAHCAMGAIDEVFDRMIEDGSVSYGDAMTARTGAKRLLASAITGEDVGPYSFESAIVSYNDAEGRTFSEVAGKFREAVRLVKEGRVTV